MAVVEKTIGSGKDHATVAAWESAVEPFGTDIYKGIISTDDNFDENVTLAGSTGTPSITSYLWLTVASANRHSGVANTSHARMYSVQLSHILQLNADFTRVEWLDIKQDQSGNSDEGIRVNAGSDDCLISYCIIWTDSGGTSQDGIYTGNWDVARLRIDNCIIYGWDRCGIHPQQFSNTPARTQTWDIDHCAIFDCGNAGTAESGGIKVTSENASDVMTIGLFNTWVAATVQNEGFADGRNNQVATPDGTVTWNGSDNGKDYSGTAEIDGTNNMTALESATDGIVATSQSSGAFIVVNNLTLGSEDLLLLDDAAGNIMAGRGIDRQGSEPDARQDFSTDITDSARPTTGVDIGPHQVSGAAAVYPPIPSSPLSQNSDVTWQLLRSSSVAMTPTLPPPSSLIIRPMKRPIQMEALMSTLVSSLG